jgi:hypothetical protein
MSEASCHNRFLKIIMHTINYNFVLDNLKLHTFYERRRCFDVLFIWDVYNCFITCPSILETVPPKTLEDFSTFYTYFSRSRCPSVRCALAANEGFNRPNVNMFDKKITNRSVGNCCILLPLVVLCTGINVLLCLFHVCMYVCIVLLFRSLCSFYFLGWLCNWIL